MNELTDGGDFGPPRRRLTGPAGELAFADPTALGPAIGAARPQRQGGAFDFDDALRTLYRWRWLILACVLAGVAAAVAITLTSTRIYRAVATISINTTPMQIMGNERDVQPRMRSEDQFLQTQYGILKSRSLAERVARNLALADDARFVRVRGGPDQRLLAAEFKLMANLEVQPVRGSNLVLLGYSDADPQRAMRVANTFATGFIDATTEQRYNATAFARAFLQKRLDSTRERLETSERELVNYAQHKGIVQLDQGAASGPRGGGAAADGPTGGGGDTLSAQSLTALNASLAGAINERIAAEQRYRQAAANASSGDVLGNPTVQALRAERAKLEADYRERLSTYKPDYPDMVELRTRIAQIDQSLSRESGDVSSSLRSAYLAALGRESELRRQVAGLRTDVLDLRNRGIGYTILQREVETNRTLYDALLQRFKEVGVVGALGESQASIVDNALAPGAPFKPRPIRNLLVGLLGGLALGLAAAFAIDFIDDTIKSPEDSLNKLKLPALGMIPRLPKSVALKDELADPKSAVAEAYYSVTTALQFATDAGMPRSVLVTSSRATEGKSSTSLALAQNLARTGVSVLLVDADLRKPSFVVRSAQGGGGLSKLLVSPDPVRDHVLPTSVPNLSLLPSGPIPPNPAELLATRRIHAILAEAQREFDLVVVDTPPVLGLADAPIMAALCEATLMVVEAEATRRSLVVASLARLAASQARIVGTVLTKFNPRTVLYGYAYGYGYGYGQRYGEETSRAPLLDVGT